MDGTDLVTGAFGNTGSVIAQLLREQGRAVRTLTGHPRESADGLDVRPFTWGDPDRLAAAFAGVDTFYNTYWMRMGDGHGGFDVAVDRCVQLIDAAERAGVRRIVHLSVAHPSVDSPYPYFRGKARVEARLEASAVPTLAVRPTLIFGGHSVLLNNLAWLLRKLPVFSHLGAVPALPPGELIDDPAALDATPARTGRPTSTWCESCATPSAPAPWWCGPPGPGSCSGAVSSGRSSTTTCSTGTNWSPPWRVWPTPTAHPPETCRCGPGSTSTPTNWGAATATNAPPGPDHATGPPTADGDRGSYATGWRPDAVRRRCGSRTAGPG